MTPLKTLMLHVDLFAGVSVSDAAQELCLLAERVGALCVADFNGVKLWARPAMTRCCWLLRMTERSSGQGRSTESPRLAGSDSSPLPVQ